MRKFFLITKQATGKQPLYVRVRKREPYLDVWINTHIDVDVEIWRRHKNVERKYTSGKDCMNVHALTRNVDSVINYSLLSGQYNPEEIRKNVYKFVFKDSSDWLEALQNGALPPFSQRRKAKVTKKSDLFTFLDGLISRMEKGRERIEGQGKNRGKKYTEGTISIWKNFRTLLKGFSQFRGVFSWEDIDKRLAADFSLYMENEDYMPKSINKYMGQFIALINRGLAEERHKNSKAAGCFIRRKIDDEQKLAEIYLTAEELNALYNMKLSGKQEIVRDVFIVGCCLCQRVSDYSVLKRENFTFTSKGLPVVKLRQKKTDKTVVIPILDDKLLTICKKYDYNLPVIANCVLNRQIKLICRKLAETVPSLRREMPTLLTKRDLKLEKAGRISFKRNALGQVVKHRYELVTSHTARRTGITLMYLTGKIDVLQMMHVSGHSSIETFKQYIRLSGEEIAEQISDKIGGTALF